MSSNLNRAPFELPEAAAYHIHRQNSQWLTTHQHVCQGGMHVCQRGMHVCQGGMHVCQRGMHATLLHTNRNASLMFTGTPQALNAGECRETQNALYCTAVHVSMHVYKPGMVCFVHQPSLFLYFMTRMMWSQPKASLADGCYRRTLDLKHDPWSLHPDP